MKTEVPVWGLWLILAVLASIAFSSLYFYNNKRIVPIVDKTHVTAEE
jgi:hypothetical protein